MTRDDVLELLDLPVRSAAVAAALELGLFGRLSERPLTTSELAEDVGIPRRRCEAWLRVLADAGLVRESGSGFEPTEAARWAILETYSADSWRMLAQESRERLETLARLPEALVRSPDRGDADRTAAYVRAMAEDPDRAARFTRMLFELHRDLAEEVAASIELVSQAHGAHRVLDLGGGSGVVALALARRWPGVEISVLDIETVCDEGRRLVSRAEPGTSIEFMPGNFLSGELPSGFDLVLECDVAIFPLELFERIRRALVPGGRFVVVDQLRHASAGPVVGAACWDLLRTLSDPDWTRPTVESVESLMAAAGFTDIRERDLGPGPGVGGREATPVMVECRAPLA